MPSFALSPASATLVKGNASPPHGDWSYFLGTTAGASEAPGSFPAKFSSATSPDCTHDDVAFALNKGGSTGIVAPLPDREVEAPISGPVAFFGLWRGGKSPDMPPWLVRGTLRHPAP